jgi:hypothetical protein
VIEGAAGAAIRDVDTSSPVVGEMGDADATLGDADAPPQTVVPSTGPA